MNEYAIGTIIWVSCGIAYFAFCEWDSNPKLVRKIKDKLYIFYKPHISDIYNQSKDEWIKDKTNRAFGKGNKH